MMNIKDTDIAIIGMAGRFPQAADITAYLENLRGGRNSVREISIDRKRDTTLMPHLDYQVIGFLEDIDKFDHLYFGISMGEARYMDPHQRLLLEVAHEAIEHAGYALEALSGTDTAVFVGSTKQVYGQLSDELHPMLITGTSNPTTAGRVSRFFNFCGTAAMVDTACSSSLLALHLACNELRQQDASLALACGVNLSLFPATRGVVSEVDIMSPDGLAKTFDESANGTAAGEAVGVVLLKPLAKALEDGDTVYAVVKGSAANQDAQRSSSLTAPSADAQAEVIQKAWRKAGLEGQLPGYIEAHGTGTKLGDPIEVEGISRAFGTLTDKKQFCAISAVKTNIGHTDSAAGISGLIKAVLSLYHKELFPSLHLSSPNPFIDFINSAVYVNTVLQHWDVPEGQTRLAGVNSFGISGTNCHVVLQEAPETQKADEDTRALPVGPILLSANTEAQLVLQATRLADWLEGNPHTEMSAIAATLSAGRTHYTSRGVLVAQHIPELVAQLRDFVPDNQTKTVTGRWVVFSGDWQPGDALIKQALHFPAFRVAWEACQATGSKLEDAVQRGFAFRYSYYKLLDQLGLGSKKIMGTGVGKLVTAVLQGKKGLKEALDDAKGFAYTPDKALPKKLKAFIDTKLAAGEEVVEAGGAGEISHTLQLLDAQLPVHALDNDSFAPMMAWLGACYKQGAVIHWEALYSFKNYQRIGLPGYPFERTHCWVKGADSLQRSGPEEWFYKPGWLEGTAMPEGEIPQNMAWLLLGEHDEATDMLHARLQDAGNEVVRVMHGTAFEKPTSHGVSYQLDMASETQVRKLYGALRQQAVEIGGIAMVEMAPVDGTGTMESIEQQQNQLLLARQVLANVFYDRFATPGFVLWQLSSQSEAVLENEQASPFKHAQGVWLRAMQSDFPQLQVTGIDVQEGCPIHEAVGYLVNEAAADPLHRFVAYRAGRRYVPRLDALPMSKTEDPLPLGKPEGTYLVTGGAGGIGLAVCEQLARDGAGKLVILGRSALPEQASWRGLADQNQKFARLVALCDQVSEVSYHAVDMGNSEGLQAVLKDLDGVNGVIHAAGVLGQQRPANKCTGQGFKNTLAPKVTGSVVLGQWAKKQPMDFFILFSSLNAIVPQANTADYAMANAFEDAYAATLRTEGLPAMAINWGVWGETGMGKRVAVESYENRMAPLRAWKTEEGIQALCMAGHNQGAQVLIGDISLEQFAQNPFFAVNEGAAGFAHKHAHGKQSPNYHIDSAASAQEKALLKIWYDLLKSPSIGLRDNFFNLGGHSLLAGRLINRVKKKWKVALAFKDVLENPTVGQMATLIDKKAQTGDTESKVVQIPLVPEAASYPLSHAQNRLWVLSQFDEASGVAYHIPWAYVLHGELDKAAFEKAIRYVAARHDALRTSIVLLEGEPRQVIASIDDFTPNLSWDQLEGADSGSQEVLALTRQEATTIFDLQSGPLWRCRMTTLGPQRCLMTLTLHHIISDGWSLNIMARELTQAYNDFKAGNTPKTPSLRLQYKDVAAWQNLQLDGASVKNHQQYWLKQLSGPVAPLNLPTDKPRPAVKSYEGSKVTFDWGGVVSDQLKSLSQQGQASLFMALHALVKLLLYKYSNQQDLIVGTPVAGREHPELESQLGLYLNTLALRSQLAPERSFNEWMSQVKSETLEALTHQSYPFDKLVDDLRLKRDTSRSPLFDVMMQVLNTEAAGDTASLQMDGLTAEPVEDQHEASQFDLSFIFNDTPRGLLLVIEYNTALFRPERVTRMAHHLEALALAVTANPEKPLKSISMLSEQEAAIIKTFSTGVPVESTITHSLVDRLTSQVAKDPDQVALVDGVSSLTLSEFDAQSTRIAQHILAMGLPAPLRIALVCGRSRWLPLGVWGILKAGAAYVPVSADYPDARKQQMLSDAGIGLILTDGPRSMEGFGLPVAHIEDWVSTAAPDIEAMPQTTAETVAYALYTSGTTGLPKSSLTCHGSVLNLANWLDGLFYKNFQGTPRALLTAAYTFDASVQQLFAPLLYGGTLVMIDEATRRDPVAYTEALCDFGTDIIDITPAYLRLVLDHCLEAGLRPPVKMVLVGGEALTDGLIADFRKVMPKDSRLVNVYGVTEATVNSTFEEVGDRRAHSHSIGKPLPGTEVWLLDTNGLPVPIGVPGELCVAGRGVALGYLNRPQLQQQRFTSHPALTKGLVYHTGDMGYWLETGELVFIGRSDHQVKLRGYRIELDEVATALGTLPEVREATVTTWGEGEAMQLVAWVAGNKALESAALQAKLREKLPAYMVPERWRLLDVLPKNQSGKIDRAALQNTPLTNEDEKQPDRPPATQEEKALVEACEAVLGTSGLGVESDFFELGGNSLKAIRLVNKLRGIYMLHINDVFAYPKLSDMSQRLRAVAQDRVATLGMLLEKESLDAQPEITEEEMARFEDYFETAIQTYDSQYQEELSGVDLQATAAYQHILLTGATGYLGAYLLRGLLNNHTTKVSVLVRGESPAKAFGRLKDKMTYYFGNDWVNSQLDSVQVLAGDVASEKLGLDEATYVQLASAVDCIINSAANVRHYGTHADFESVNVDGPRRLLAFCREGRQKSMHHISTMSVAGGKVPGKPYMLYTEYDRDVGQEAGNFYVRSKLAAEKMLANEPEVTFYRVGSVMFDSSTGRFQENMADNAFYHSLRHFIDMGHVPAIGLMMEFSYVDKVAEAVLRLFDKQSLHGMTHHLYNPETPDTAQFVTFLSNCGYEITLNSLPDFLRFLLDHHEKYQEVIDGLLFRYQEFIQADQPFTYFRLASGRTLTLLKQLGFDWPPLAQQHIDMMVKHCQDRGYFPVSLPYQREY
ncbi:amino acid adenylation domain-containing protein [Maribacter sp. 2-571]|uniref:amino acid adenylation domain-containing protein n=1 Tax=Maribacter sp. 2-571 TaxID=3417569 RepID=UPI003D3509E0